ncbi:hypothetical protein ALC62_02604, partial [Cyphomyrmex costatus]
LQSATTVILPTEDEEEKEDDIKNERGTNQGRREGGEISRAAAFCARCTDDCPARPMIDRCDCGLSNSQLVARHVRIIMQHASSPFLFLPPSLFISIVSSVKGNTCVNAPIEYLRPASRPLMADIVEELLHGPIRNAAQRDDRRAHVHGIHYSGP